MKKNENIEYFDSLKSAEKGINIAGMLTFKNQSAFKVKTDETRFDEIGMVNFYGIVSKRRAEMNKFHERYMVLRGFDLYWYKNVDAKEQKGICPVPSKPITSGLVVGNKKCFVLDKEDGVKESRRLVFLDNDLMRSFKMQVTMMSNLKRYIEVGVQLNKRIEPAIVDYLKSKLSDEIEVKEESLSDDYCFGLFLSQFNYHSTLIKLSLVGCKLTDRHVEELVSRLKLIGSTLEHIDLSENMLTIKAIYALKPVLKNSKDFKSLSSLVLDRNELNDDGVKELANGLTDRF